ncbi:hypothetical protein [Terrilactibacillus laevilacticus]|uniref:TetR/AcrR family transcriptional regulator n=1 Tax=Terrilactibacillus laevilacticus TaxID=1380157 RepID=A0ABW5PRJ6_9BACI|nr:hypothetical protein [Terrilactibacillus laevilacticus]
MKAFIEWAQKKNIKYNGCFSQSLSISKRTIYERFSSIQDILDAIVHRSFDDIKHRKNKIIHERI